MNEDGDLLLSFFETADDNHYKLRFKDIKLDYTKRNKIGEIRNPIYHCKFTFNEIIISIHTYTSVPLESSKIFLFIFVVELKKYSS